jgi:hypothetical protein
MINNIMNEEYCKILSLLRKGCVVLLFWEGRKKKGRVDRKERRKNSHNNIFCGRKNKINKEIISGGIIKIRGNKKKEKKEEAGVWSQRKERRGKIEKN